MARAFLHEAEVHALAARAGISPPRHAWSEGAGEVFAGGEPVVIKGLADGLWHKTELGALAFLPWSPEVGAAVVAMRVRVEAAGYGWIGGLVCERVKIARADGLPSEAFVSLTRAGGRWTVVMGLGGLQAEALGALVPPLRWPVAWVTPQDALGELRGHLLGLVWLGRLRGAKALTDEARVLGFLEALWRLAEVAEGEGLELVEMNPVALDESGVPRPLDGVGQRRAAAVVEARPRPGPFLDAVLRPRRVAVMGVSTRPDSPGHMIVDNLGRGRCELVIVKEGARELLGVPCVPGLASLVEAPVDILIFALPAAASVAGIEELVRLGGGARVVALVAGGIGDGADHEGLARRVELVLAEARAAGRWAPAVLGPNFVGHVVPALGLDTTFIPHDRWRAAERSGGVALVSQSGAFMLSRLARAPELGLGVGLALGNQLDVDLGDALEGLETEAGIEAVAAYVEGFGPGQLERVARAAARLRGSGRPVLMYRAGRTSEGQAAAASHTGALAGDLALEEAVLRRAGVRMAPTIAAFDAALAWLGAFPKVAPGPVAVVSNAGFETVSGADRVGGSWPAARLSEGEAGRLGEVLARHGLAGLVSARLPLDLTPMASFEAYAEAVELVFGGEAAVVIVGLVPFTRRLDVAIAEGFARRVAEGARRAGKAVGFAVDGGPGWAALEATLRGVGLPVFGRVEDALVGLVPLG